MENLIEQKRKELNLTQQALGDKLNVSRQTIISLENGKYNPSLTLAFALARIFNCSIEELFIFQEEK